MVYPRDHYTQIATTLHHISTNRPHDFYCTNFIALYFAPDDITQKPRDEVFMHLCQEYIHG